MCKRTVFTVLMLCLSLTLTVFAQLDERLVGRWKSSTGATIDISHPKVGDGRYTKMVINGKTKLDGQVDYGDMDSLILKYKSSGSDMEAYYDPQTKIITVYNGDKEYATWKKL